MKRVTAYILLMIYLLGSTEASQLLKLPALFTHFTDHKIKTGSNESFAQYLAEHYGSIEHHDGDHHDDGKLPFSTVDDCCAAGHTSILVSGFRLESPLPKYIERNISLFMPANYYQVTPDGIFQPPRS